jgi:multiple sugar transport system permease protein
MTETETRGSGLARSPDHEDHRTVATAPAASPPRRPRWWRTPRGEQRVVGYSLLLPAVLGLAIFVVGPIIGSFYISVTDWSGIGERQFVGLDNYDELLHDGTFRHSLKVTLVYTVWFVPLLYVLSLALALLINQNLKFNGVFRTLYFLPFMFSLVVTSIVWTFMLDERAGIFNVVLGKFGIESQSWLGDAAYAPWALVIVTLWQAIGYSMIIFLAGLQDIPRDYHEAATIDGAGAVKRFRTITLPLLKPTSVFVLVISIIGAIQLFDPIYVMTQGGPFNATQTAVFYMYQNAFQYFRFGYASALAVVLFVILLITSLTTLRLFRHDPNY